jgi:threonine/homoserine/homoserine lactone efflux protein
VDARITAVLASYAAAAVALAVLAALPGPDVAVVTRFALSDGRRAAVQAELGVVLGLVAWGGLTVLGLAALLAASAQAYTALKLAGAAYLVLMGVRMLRRRDASAAPSPAAAGELPGAGGALRAGLFTNMLNPKIAVFYTGALPALVPRGGAPALWLAILVATHVALSLGWLTAYALVFSRSRALLGAPRVRERLERVTGVALIALGLSVAQSAR